MPSINRALKESEEVQKRRKAEHELHELITQFTNIFENLDEMIFSVDAENNCFLQVSPACEKIYGYYPKAFYENMNLWRDLIHPEDRQSISEMDKLLESGKKVINNYRIFRKDGDIRWVESRIVPVLNNSGKLVRLDGIVSDITNRIRAQMEISNSLQEKELLLKELNHRVKNNLQVISSLLKLQVAQVKDIELHQLFMDTQNRVKSMSFIHECLFQTNIQSDIKFSDYLKKLINHLFIVYGFDKRSVNYKINADNIYLNIDTAVPCGLLVNEVVSNSLKYAFPGNHHGEIDVNFAIEKDHIYNLKIRDNGIGLSQDLINNNNGSLGIKLINTLVKQLDGKIEINSNSGTEYKITFSELQYKNRY